MSTRELTGESRRLAEEILHHATSLLDGALPGAHKDLLLRIRQASDQLLNGLTAFDNTNASETTAAVSDPATTTQEWTPHILLVEDNPFTQKLMTRLLHQQGYRVTLAQHGQEATEQWQQLNPDLILMDLRMPVMDGFQATREIRQRELQLADGKHVPIIAVTALIADEEQQRAREVGMDGYHAKPVRAAMLFSEMEQLLNLHATPPPAAVAPPEAHQSRVVVDMERLLKTVDGDLDLLKEIATLYFADAPRQMSRIERALATGDTNEIREAAHSLKGATGAFGRIRVYDLALSLEQAGKQAEIRLAGELWFELTSALRTMEETIQKEIAHLSGGAS